MPAQLTIRFANLGREVLAYKGETVLQCARRTGVRIVGACGGRGTCGSCKVRILSGDIHLVRPDAVDEECAEPRREWVRACLVRPITDCIVEVASRAAAPVVRVDVEGDDTCAVYPLAPVVRSHDVELGGPVVAEVSPALERLLAALGEGTANRIDLGALQTVPMMLNQNAWRLRASIRDGEMIGVGPHGQRKIGLAVDLGTTNVAAYLTDLESGKCLARLGIENPQVAYGADLITRVNHAIRTPHGHIELQSAAVTAITSLAKDLCAAVDAPVDAIVDIAVCANTAMHHLLLDLPVSQLGRAPFVPATCVALDVKARDLGLAMLPGAYVHLLPNVGGFVGGDHVATLLATEERWSDSTTVVIDIGTNTEVSLMHRGTIITTSTASGPAFEGGNISAGMRAAEGAIERVRFVDGEIRIDVIGDVEPVGLCGSGVIDVLAALREAEIINRRGSICSGHPGVRDNYGRREYLLASQVAFTQDDVRAVQLAKAAIRAGLDMLLREAGLAEEAIAHVVIAGAFGHYLDIASAIAIGMFPPLPMERFAQVGNAAGAGVRMALASGATREHASHLATRCRHLELGTRPDFQKAFLGRIGF